jgi:hypothetical protein
MSSAFTRRYLPCRSRVSAKHDIYSGHLQTAGVTQPLPEPLVVAAYTATGGPLANTPIAFEINRGSGALSASQPSKWGSW